MTDYTCARCPCEPIGAAFSEKSRAYAWILTAGYANGGVLDCWCDWISTLVERYFPELAVPGCGAVSPMEMDLSDLDSHSQEEEVANSVIHGIGAVLAAAALALLVTFASLIGDPWRIVSFSIYGASLVVLYVASTLFHGFRNPRLKQLFRIFDHAAIYLLIAGSYTPFLLVTIRGPLGWTLFGVTWGFAILGVIQATFFLDRLKFFSLIAYLGMGWLIVAALKPLIALLPLGGIVWLAIGGVCYTLGVVFYVSKRIPYNHAIWHLFVLAGSISHFFSMLFYVLPERA